MFGTVKKITGRSIRASLVLFVVFAGVQTAGLHRVEASSYISNVETAISVENGIRYMVAPSPVSSNGPAGSPQHIMSLTYNASSGELFGITGISTFDSWPTSPYNWSISIGTQIPLSAVNMDTLSNGDYVTFICVTAGSLCSGVDWGYAGYPTLSEAENSSGSYKVNFSKTAGVLSFISAPPVPGPELNSTYTSRFLSQTINGTRSGFTIATQYFLNTSELDDTNTPNSIRTDIVNSAGVSVVAYINTTTYKNINGNNTSTSTLTTVNFDPPTNLLDGTYNAITKFYSTALNGHVLTRSFIQTQFIVSGASIFVSTTTLISDGQDTIIPNYTDKPCGLTSLSGCIVNAFAYLFLPSTETLNTISEFNENLSNRFPFAYIYDFKNSIQGLYSNTESELTPISFNFAGLGELTLLSKEMVESIPFSSLINVLLGYFIWLTFAFQMYHRTLKIFNTNPS